uniref:Uncharacterized protein n=1 Tax=Serinus canaria TaxID=9135 RepID=A0A8C9L1K4_SERCA
MAKAYDHLFKLLLIGDSGVVGPSPSRNLRDSPGPPNGTHRDCLGLQSWDPSRIPHPGIHRDPSPLKSPRD